jgi:hypothetical protein
MVQPLAEVQNRVCRPGPLPVAKKMKNLHILEEPLYLSAYKSAGTISFTSLHSSQPSWLYERPLIYYSN